MRRAWFCARELAGLPGLPGTERGVQLRATADGWAFREVATRGGYRREYALDTLPAEVRRALAPQLLAPVTPAAKAGAEAGRALAEARVHAAAERRAAREAGLAVLETLAPKRRSVAEARHALLEACEAYLQTAGYRAGETWSKAGVLVFLDDLAAGKLGLREAVRLAVARKAPKLSYPTLLGWREARAAGGIAALAPGYAAHNRGESQVSPVMMEHLEGVLYEHPHIQPRKLALLLEGRFGRELAPSEAAVRRRVERWKAENASTWAFVVNPDQWKQRHLASVGRADGDVLRLNQRWELDSTPADLLFEGSDARWSLLVCVEVYSRDLLIVISPTSRAAAVAALIRRGLLTWGPPEQAKTDNGQDYVARHIVHVFEALEVEQVLCPPFSPEKKPHVEAAIKTFLHDLVELMPGYVGHSVPERQAIEARRTFAQRMFQKEHAERLRCTPEAFLGFVEQWLAVYRQRPHGGLGGKSPLEVQRAWPAQPNYRPVPRLDNERALDVLLMEAPKDGGWRTVRKQTITVDRGRYADDEGRLAAWEDQRVYVKLDPTDLGRICVYGVDPDTGLKAFVCWAVDPSLPGIDRAAFAGRVRSHEKAYVQEGKRDLAKKAKAYGREKALADELLEAEAARYANVVALPAAEGERPVYTTPALDEAARAAEALDAPAAGDDPLGDIIFADERAAERRKNQVYEVFASPIEMYNAYRRKARRGELADGDVTRMRETWEVATPGERKTIQRLHGMGLGAPAELAVWEG